MTLEVYFPWRWTPKDVSSWIAGRVYKLTTSKDVVDGKATFDVARRDFKLQIEQEPSFTTKAFIIDSKVLQFFASYNMTIPRTQTFWRMTEKVVGEINGLANSRGVIAVTDGLSCFIVRGDNSLFQGHAMWFVPDDKGVDVEELIGDQSRKKARKIAKEIDVILEEG